MRGFGTGSKLWRTEVVLRVPQRDAERNQESLLEGIAAAATLLDIEAVTWPRDIEPTWSYDIQPPPPDAGVGVGCWVLADSVGDAAETSWRAVLSASRALSTEASLWDLRVIPRDAILDATPTGTPLPR